MRPSQLSQALDRARSRAGRAASGGRAGATLEAGDREVVGLHRARSRRGRARRCRRSAARSARPVAVEVLAARCGAGSPRGSIRLLAVTRKPRFGVARLRQLLVGDVAVPLVLAGPARLRQVGAVARAGSGCGRQLVADAAVAVGPEQVGDRALRARRASSTSSAPLVGSRTRGLGRVSRRHVERRQAQRQRLGLVGAEDVVDDRAVVGRADLEPLGLGAAPDGDLLARRSRAARHSPSNS